MKAFSGKRFPHATGLGAVITLTALALITSACSSDSGEVPSALESASHKDKEDKAKTDAVKLSDKPLWSKETHDDLELDKSLLNGTRILGDKVAFVREDDEAQTRLVVADAKSGKAAWKLDKDDTLPGSGDLLADHLSVEPLGAASDAKALLVEYHKAATLADGSTGEEEGIAALSLKDGRMLWSLPVSIAPENDDVVLLEAASSSHVALSLIPVNDDSRDNELIMVDAEEHEIAWRKKSLDATGFAGGTVIADKEEAGDEVTVVGLKASNGEKRWELDGGEDPRILAITPESIVASVSEAVHVIEPESGDTREKLGISANFCRFDGKTTVACQVHENDLGSPATAISVIEGIDTKPTTTPLANTDDVTLTNFHNGRIFSEGRDSEGGTYVALDTAGTTIAKKLPGRLIDLSESVAVFAYSRDYEETVMEIYEVET
ncbi:MAG: PQQ-binding-like beta-propeller repeat protein [Stackebrandtia sp.]